MPPQWATVTSHIEVETMQGHAVCNVRPTVSDIETKCLLEEDSQTHSTMVMMNVLCMSMMKTATSGYHYHCTTVGGL